MRANGANIERCAARSILGFHEKYELCFREKTHRNDQKEKERLVWDISTRFNYLSILFFFFFYLNSIDTN